MLTRKRTVIDQHHYYNHWPPPLLASISHHYKEIYTIRNLKQFHHIDNTWYDLSYLSLGSPAHHASVVARVGECCPGNVEAALGAAGKKVGSHAGTKIWKWFRWQSTWCLPSQCHSWASCSPSSRWCTRAAPPRCSPPCTWAWWWSRGRRRSGSQPSDDARRQSWW